MLRVQSWSQRLGTCSLGESSDKQAKISPPYVRLVSAWRSFPGEAQQTIWPGNSLRNWKIGVPPSWESYSARLHTRFATSKYKPSLLALSIHLQSLHLCHIVAFWKPLTSSALSRPSFVEFSATQSLPFQSSVTEHYLASYKDSLLAICAAQFGKKGFRHGIEVNIAFWDQQDSCTRQAWPTQRDFGLEPAHSFWALSASESTRQAFQAETCQWEQKSALQGHFDDYDFRSRRCLPLEAVQWRAALALLQGLKGLIESGEVTDVLSASFKGDEKKTRKKKKQMGKRETLLENLGGWALFQGFANIQRGVENRGKDVFQTAQEVITCS